MKSTAARGEIIILGRKRSDKNILRVGIQVDELDFELDNMFKGGDVVTTKNGMDQAQHAIAPI